MTDAGGLKEIASNTEGFTGADLKALLYNAQLLAAHEALERRKTETEKERRESQHSLSELSPTAMIADVEAEDEWPSSKTLLLFRRTLSGVKDCQDKSQTNLLSKVSLPFLVESV